MPHPPAPSNTSHGQQLAETRLGRPFSAFVAELREANPGIGWRTIADELADKTGIRVSYMTVRSWAGKRAA